MYFGLGVMLTTAKKFCSLKYNWDHKLLFIESYIEISPVVLELFLWLKQGNELNDNLLEFYKHDLLFLLLSY